MVFGCEAVDDHEEVVFVSALDCGLRAIVAVPSTALGPAIGGCRILPYIDEACALHDVLQLSRRMTYKAVAASVPFGGGKTVVIAASQTRKSPALLRALGRTIDRLGRRYITGEDVGTTVTDMAEIGRATPHVMGLPEEAGGSGDPSPRTALGCFVGIEAGADHHWGTGDLKGSRMLVHGLGNVGFNLCRLLASAGASLLASEIKREAVRACADRFGATPVDPESVVDAQADIYAPCAPGGVGNDRTIERFKVDIVAGGANIQLARACYGAALRERKILYAPDCIINTGGMIQLAVDRLRREADETERRVRHIGETLAKIFRNADADNVATNAATDRLVESRLRPQAAQVASA